MAGSVGTAVVLGEQLDVLVMLAPVDLVLDAVVREVNLAVEVRQVVLARPLANLALVAVRTAVAIDPAAIVFLQELLILALQVLLEDDASNLESVVLVAKTGFLLPIRRVEVRVVLDFALTADAGVERLRWLLVAIHGMRIEQIAAFACERQDPPVVAQIQPLHQAFVAQVFQRVVVDIEVVFGHDAKGADSSQHAAVLAVQFVQTIADHDQLALLAARQVEVAHQPLARVVVAVPFVVHACASILPPVTVARVISRIEHGCPPDMALR
jgi:hypothetical protein